MTDGWTETTIEDLCDLYDHLRVPLNSRERALRRGPYPYYGAQGIVDWIDDYRFEGRYILVPEDGANLTTRKLPIAFFATGKFWVNNHAHVLRAKVDRADDIFLKHAINTLNIAGYITGAAQPKLSQANLKRIKLWMPPLPTQRRIAAILSAYDELIEVNTRRIAILEEMARRVYEEWFVRFRFPGGNGQKPPDWTEVDLGAASTNFDRLRKPLSKMQRAERQGPYPYYGAAKIFDHVDDYIFDGEYLLLAEDGSVATKDGFPMLQYVSGRFWANNHTHILQGAGQFSTVFLYLALSRTPVGAYVTGAAQPKITQANLNRMPVSQASVEVHADFDERVKPMLKLVIALERMNANLRAQRDLLLPRLVSGKLSVDDAERHIKETAA